MRGAGRVTATRRECDTAFVAAERNYRERRRRAVHTGIRPG